MRKSALLVILIAGTWAASAQSASDYENARYGAFDYLELEGKSGLTLFMEQEVDKALGPRQSYFGFGLRSFVMDLSSDVQGELTYRSELSLYLQLADLFKSGLNLRFGASFDLLSLEADPLGGESSAVSVKNLYGLQTGLDLMGLISADVFLRRGTIKEILRGSPDAPEAIGRETASRYLVKGTLNIGRLLRNLRLFPLLESLRFSTPVEEYIRGWNSSASLNLGAINVIGSWGKNAYLGTYYGGFFVNDALDIVEFESQWFSEFSLARNYTITASPFTLLLSLLGISPVRSMGFQFYHVGFGWMRMDDPDLPFGPGNPLESPVFKANLLMAARNSPLVLRMQVVLPFSDGFSDYKRLSGEILGTVKF